MGRNRGLPLDRHPHKKKDFVHAYVVLLIAIVHTGCRGPAWLEQRYAQASTALRHGKLQDARRLASYRAKQDSAWNAKFRILEAEVILADGRAEEGLRLLSSPVTDDRLEARRLMIQGNGLLKLDRYDEARRVLDESGKRAADLKAIDLAVEVDLLKGSLLTIQNKVPEAGRILGEALERARQLHDPYLQSQALNGLAVNRIRAFRYDEALAFATEALPLAVQAGAERLRASALGNLGLCYARLGNFEKAYAHAQQGVAIREKLGDASGLHIALGFIGNINMLEGDARSAIPRYRRALEGARQLHFESYSSAWAANLAEALVETGDWEAAAQLSREAQRHTFPDEQIRASAKLTMAEIAQGRKQFTEAERILLEVIDSGPGNPAQLWEAHASLGNLYRESGQLHRAEEHFDKAIRLMEQTRSELFRAEHRVTFLSRWIRFYQNYVDLLMEEGDSGRAFRVAELSRARVLGETMGWRRVQRNSARLAAYQRSARRMGACFLSYWIAPRRSFLWVITPTATRTITLPGEREISVLVDAHQKAILNSQDPASDASAVGGLYSILLGEAAALIPAHSKVVVAPDGPLHNLNFETLPVFGTSSRYWVEDVTLTITPSLSLLLSQSAVKPKSPASLLIIGNPEPAGSDFPKLAHADKEMTAIERSFPNVAKAVFSGNRANPSAYRESQPERFSMIHFAAHGLANRTSPLDSAVVLSPQGGAFLLYARDIAEHPLRARVVTIASCQSAGAKSYPGEGLLGLAWAFLRAGADEVIAALWDVADIATVEMMTTLYGSLAAGKAPAEALHTAKLAMVRRSDAYHKPYYWGAFQNYISTPRLPESVHHISRDE